MSLFYDYFQKLYSVNIYSYDFLKYEPDADILEFIVFGNYEGHTYYSNPILIDVKTCCNWNDYKWELKPNTKEIIKLKGMHEIVDLLLGAYPEKRMIV